MLHINTSTPHTSHTWTPSHSPHTTTPPNLTHPHHHTPTIKLSRSLFSHKPVLHLSLHFTPPPPLHFTMYIYTFSRYYILIFLIYYYLAILYIYILQERKNILKMNKEIGMMPKKELYSTSGVGEINNYYEDIYNNLYLLTTTLTNHTHRFHPLATPASC